MTSDGSSWRPIVRVEDIETRSAVRCKARPTPTGRSSTSAGTRRTTGSASSPKSSSGSSPGVKSPSVSQAATIAATACRSTRFTQGSRASAADGMRSAALKSCGSCSSASKCRPRPTSSAPLPDSSSSSICSAQGKLTTISTGGHAEPRPFSSLAPTSAVWRVRANPFEGLAGKSWRRTLRGSCGGCCPGPAAELPLLQRLPQHVGKEARQYGIGPSGEPCRSSLCHGLQ